ncbi:MAG: alpha/beta hydrolase [Betaproteobacteria bacterium]|nr:MAG: alpha/beta hydrolase [Betaproteobacteria bacterium]
MVLHILLLVGIGYATLTLLVYIFQSRLLYFPEIGREVIATPRTVGLPFEDVWLDLDPGTRVHGWFVPRSDARGAVLILHGNAGSIGLRLDWLRMFHELGYASLIIDYRGYGRSGGKPSEQATYEDAQAAWDHLTRSRGWKPGEIVIVGESLGGPIAAHLAARAAPRALVLQSTFTSVPDLASELYWFLPVRWISRFRYDTRDHLRRVSAPVLVAHSREDEIIPYRHGRALFEQAREPKRFVEMRGGHNDAFLFSRREWTQALQQFLDDVAKAAAR